MAWYKNIQTILILGDYPQTLAVVRSLGRARHRVIVAHTQKHPIAARSRHCADTWRCPEFTDETFSTGLLEYLRQNPEVKTLYPIGIDSIVAVQALTDELDGSHQLVGVSSEILAVFNDKNLANETVRQAGVEVPRSFQVTELGALSDAAFDLGFPVIIKSSNNAGPVLGRKAYIVNDQAQLETDFAKWPSGHSGLMVQRYVQGKIAACDFVAREGELLAYYESAHARTDAADGTGYVVDFRAISPTPALVETLQKIVSHTRYSGPGLLQCAIAPDTGTCSFIELNPRLSAGVAEAVNAGLDLPLIALHSSLGYRFTPVRADSAPRYRVNARSYWLERDLVGLFRQWRGRKWGENIRHVRVMFSSLLNSEAHINWSWRDPAPSLYIALGYLRRALSPLKSRIRVAGRLAGAYVKAVRAGHRLPPGRLADLDTQEFQDRRYLLKQSSDLGCIFKAMRWHRLIICVVGLETCRRILAEKRDHLRSNSVDLKPLFPKGILRNLEGDDHRHYRQALVAAIGAEGRSDAAEFDAKTIRHWLHQHAIRFPGCASSARELTKTLDKIATALLIRRYFAPITPLHIR